MENGVVNVANRIDPDMFDVRFCCLIRRGAFADRLLRNGDAIDVLEKPNGKSLATVYRLWRSIARCKPNVVHTHNLGTLIYAAPATCWGRTAPILHGVHSELPDSEQTPKRIHLRQRCYGAARRIHTVTQGLTDHLTDLKLDVRPIDTITNGVDLDVYRPDAPTTLRTELGIPQSAFVIGVVARFGAYKRHEATLDAFDVLAADHPDVHLVFVGGSGPRKTAVEARHQASPHADRIHLAGFCPKPAEVYPAFDVLAIPSVREGLSNAALEAMASEVPVLTNSSCGAADAITHGKDGWIADLTEQESFVAALQETLAARNQLPAFSHAAREAVRARFSMQVMVDGYTELYQQIANRN